MTRDAHDDDDDDARSGERSDDPPAAARPLARWQGPERSAPYPLSRMAPAFDLVDAAREIQRADEMLATVTGGKLELIAEQIRTLQEQARRLMARAQRDAELHRARCNFEKTPGGVYHLYRRHDSGETWFLMLGPNEWTTEQPHTWLGTYRLERDMSFTPLEEAPSIPEPS